MDCPRCETPLDELVHADNPDEGRVVETHPCPHCDAPLSVTFAFTHGTGGSIRGEIVAVRQVVRG